MRDLPNFETPEAMKLAVLAEIFGGEVLPPEAEAGGGAGVADAVSELVGETAGDVFVFTEDPEDGPDLPAAASDIAPGGPAAVYAEAGSSVDYGVVAVDASPLMTTFSVGKPPKDGDSPGGGGGGGGGGKGGNGGDGGGIWYSRNGAEYTRDADYATTALDGFEIALNFASGISAEIQTALKNAANYLTSVIQNDLFVLLDDGTHDTIITARRVKTDWDDLLIDIKVENIDGTNGILAQAVPTSFWPTSDAYGEYMPAKGQITFDAADFGDGGTYLSYYQEGDAGSLESLLQSVAMHEIMHVLGFGSIWGAPDPLFNPAGRSLVSGNEYQGLEGNQAFQEEYTTTSNVPVEPDGGNGTAGGHWDDGPYADPADLTQSAVNVTDGSTDTLSFATELMVGYINVDAPKDAYMSYTSMAALEDLGYEIAYQDYGYDNYLIDDPFAVA